MEQPDYVPDITKQKLVMIFLFLPIVFFFINLVVDFPDFLKNRGFDLVYGLAGFVVIIIYLISLLERSEIIEAFVSSHYPRDVTLFQVAFFLYGKHRAVQTAILELAIKKLLVVNEDRLFIVGEGTIPGAVSNPLANLFCRGVLVHK